MINKVTSDNKCILDIDEKYFLFVVDADLCIFA